MVNPVGGLGVLVVGDCCSVFLRFGGLDVCVFSIVVGFLICVVGWFNSVVIVITFIWWFVVRCLL